MKLKSCDTCGYYEEETFSCKYPNSVRWREGSGCTGWKPMKEKPLANADRINAMSVEEKAEWFEENATGCPPGLECYGPSANPSRQDCIKCWLDWLKQEVKE